MWLDDLGGGPDTVTTLVAESGLSAAQVDAAIRYRATYPDEVSARIELHRRETTAAEAV